MVDKEQIWEVLKNNFAFSRPVDIDDHGVVSAVGVDNLYPNFTTWNGKRVKHLPLRFGVVKRHFNVSDSNLATLDGCPHTVEGSFKCNGNFLKTLEGGPTAVAGGYICYNNPLESLRGAPSHIRGEFLLQETLIGSFEGGPKKVDGFLLALECHQLRTLDGFPEAVPHVVIEWHKDLPLLRTLVANEINFASTQFPEKAAEVMMTMRPFAGLGKRGAIKCQKALIAAGFEGNARW
jgi:hypothetical protein